MAIELRYQSAIYFFSLGARLLDHTYFLGLLASYFKLTACRSRRAVSL